MENFRVYPTRKIKIYLSTYYINSNHWWLLRKAGSQVRKEQSRRVNGNKRARLTRPLHLTARCMSLVEHTSFADHSIRRSRMLWRDVNAWQKQAGNRISVSRRIRACVYTRLYVSYSRNAAKDIRNGCQHLSGMRKVESIKVRIYMRERTRKGEGKISLYNRISSSNRIPCLSWEVLSPRLKDPFSR